MGATAMTRNRLRGAGEPIAVLSVLIVLASFLVLVPVPADARAAAPCTDVEIIGLRGSHEEYLAYEHGMGSLLGPLADSIAGQLSGSLTASFYGVPYRAVDASPGTVAGGEYFESKDEGSALLHDHLLERISDCPGTRFVVLGYSQGAHAAGDLLAREGTYISNRIAALVMFGDPRFNPKASYDWGSFDPHDHGLAGARSLSDFSGWSSRVISFCHNDDIVCQGASIWFDHGGAAHDQQRYLDDYGDIAAGWVRKRLGLTAPAHLPLDLAFVIDSTGSMGSSIEEVREAVSEMVDRLESKESDFRLGLVDYKDTDQGDPYAAQTDLDLGPDVEAFHSAVASLPVYGGGDYPEAVYSGLMDAFTQLSWRPEARKAVILIGDAPGKDPEPITGYTLGDVLSAAAGLPGAVAHVRALRSFSASAVGGDSAAIYPLAVGYGPLETFDPLAAGSGGELFTTEGSEEVSEQLVEAVSSAATPVEVVLSSVRATRPGTPVDFVAHASYAEGEISRYEWDFDGDGVSDEATVDGNTQHTFDFPYEGDVKVTAFTGDGHHGSATSFVEISEDAPLPPGPPSDLQATSDAPNSLQLRWGEPASLSGGDLLGYQLTVESEANHLPVAAGPVDASKPEVRLNGLAAGPYIATVTAVTEAGEGSSAQALADVEGPQVPAPGMSSPPAAPVPVQSTLATRRIKCRKHQRRLRVHGKPRCVTKKHRHHHRAHK